MIWAMTEADLPVVARIYREGIETGNATFETAIPDWSDWDASHHGSCRLVVEEDGEVLAWTALSSVSRRPVYRGLPKSASTWRRRPGNGGSAPSYWVS